MNDMEMQMGRDLGLLLPEITVLLTAVAALVAEMLRKPLASLGLALLGLLIATVLTIPLLGSQTTVFMGTYRIDTLGVWAKLILLPLAALIIVLVRPEIKNTGREGTVYSLLVFTTVGALVLASAGDTMFVVLGLLLSSLGSFGLVGYPRTNRATEAALKYFVYGSVTEAVMIFGLTFWFGATGSTAFADLPRLSTQPFAAGAGLVGILIGLGYKASIAPFHFWAPDAYDGAPLAAAAFLSTVPKIGAIFALSQVFSSPAPSALNWPVVVALLAVFSMTYGNLAALSQSNLVRLLAYSSIAQAGYFLLGVVALGKSGLALQSLVVFAAAYAAMNLGAFAVVARTGREIKDFTGLGRTSPWSGAAMVIFLLSLVGVPPLAGFAGKLLLFGAALDAGLGWLALIAILNSVLSLAVYLRIIVPMYQPPATSPSSHLAPARLQWVGLVWAIALVLTAGMGLAVQLFLSQVV